MVQTTAQVRKFEDISPAVYYSVYTPVFLVGVVGNSLLIFIIVCHKRMKTVPNRYICNLAMSSLMCIAVSALYPLLDNDQVVPKAMCVLTQLLRRTCLTANVLTLTALSIERYHAVSYPLRKDSGLSVNLITTIIVIFIWCLSLSLALISITTEDEIMCSRSGPWFYSKALQEKTSLFSFLFMYLLPLLTIAAFFVLTAQELHRVLLSIRDHSESTLRIIDVRKKMTWVVLVLVAVFALTHLPFYVISLIYYDRKNPYEKITVIFLSLTNLQACANPIILYGLSEPCRRHIKYYLFTCCFKCLAPPVACPEDGQLQKPSRSEQFLCTTV